MTEEQASSDPFVPQLVDEALRAWVREVETAWLRVWAEIVRNDGRGERSQAPYGVPDCKHDPKPCQRCDPLGERARWIIKFVEGAAAQVVLKDPRFERLRKIVDEFWRNSESGTGETTGLAVEVVQAGIGPNVCLLFDSLVFELARKVHGQFAGLLDPANRSDALGYFREAHANRIGPAGLLERWNKLVGFPLGDVTSVSVNKSPSNRKKLARPGVGRKKQSTQRKPRKAGSGGKARSGRGRTG